MTEKQVDKSHYQFSKYVTKKRWISIWHQVEEVIKLKPTTLLEIGIGSGVFKIIASFYNISAKTVDIDHELNPDYVASATELPLKNNSFDCVCAFQMLEHLPYEQSLIAFSEMVRVAKKNIVISLPDSRKLYPFSFYIPLIGTRYIFIPRFRLKARVHIFYGQHYWEINKKGYPLKKIISDLSSTHIKLNKTFRVIENLDHRFFVFEKKQ